MTFPLSARDAVRALRSSKIREVANVGMGRKDVLPFWFGEPDEVTPEFIRRAGIAALEAGDTFYTQNLGIPPLRELIFRERIEAEPTLIDDLDLGACGCFVQYE